MDVDLIESLKNSMFFEINFELSTTDGHPCPSVVEISDGWTQSGPSVVETIDGWTPPAVRR